MSFLKRLNIFSVLTKDPKEQRNMYAAGAEMVLLSGHTALPGNLYTKLCNDMGITPEMGAPYALPQSILSPIAALAVAPFLDHIRNKILFQCFMILTLLFNIATPILVCIGPAYCRTIPFVLISGMVCGCLVAVLGSPRMGMDGAVSARIMHNEVRGRFYSIAGMCVGIFGVLVGLYATWIAKRFDARMAVLLACIPSFLLCCASAFANYFKRELPDLGNIPMPKRQSPLKDLAKVIGMREFRVMMPANFLRGLGDGAASYAFWIALKRLNLPAEYAGYVTIISSAAPFVGYGIIWLVMDRFGAGLVIPVSDVLLAIGLMGTVMTNEPLLFLAFFLLRTVMYHVESTAIPLAHYEVVPTEVMGSFSSLRLLLLILTGNVSGVIAGMLMKYVSPFSVFAGSAVIKLAAGALYCYGVFALRKNKTAA